MNWGDVFQLLGLWVAAAFALLGLWVALLLSAERVHRRRHRP